jgi:hypothetical protein
MNEIDQVIRSAETLESQIREPTRSAAAASGDALAVLLLRARSYLPRDLNNASSGAESLSSDKTAVTVIAGGGSPVSLQLSTDRLAGLTDGTGDTASDLAALIRGLRARRAELEAELGALGREVQSNLEVAADPASRSSDPIEQALSQATADLQLLRAQQAELARTRDALVSQRDILRTTYTTLLNKAEELRTARATTVGREAVVAERAVPPRAPSEPRTLVNVAMAALWGGVLGVLLVFGVEWWRRSARRARPGAARQESLVPDEAATVPVLGRRQS